MARIHDRQVDDYIISGQFAGGKLYLIKANGTVVTVEEGQTRPDSQYNTRQLNSSQAGGSVIEGVFSDGQLTLTNEDGETVVISGQIPTQPLPDMMGQSVHAEQNCDSIIGGSIEGDTITLFRLCGDDVVINGYSPSDDFPTEPDFVIPTTTTTTSTTVAPTTTTTTTSGNITTTTSTTTVNCDTQYTISNTGYSFTQSTVSGGENTISFFGILYFDEDMSGITVGDVLYLSNEAQSDPSFITKNGETVTNINVTAVDISNKRIQFFAEDFEYFGENTDGAAYRVPAGIGFCNSPAIV